MNKLFEEQQATSKVVTEEILEQLQNKNYTNGDPINVGDQVLYAWKEGEILEEDKDGMTVLPLELVSLNKDQIDQYDIKPESQHLQIPVIKRKGEVHKLHIK